MGKIIMSGIVPQLIAPEGGILASALTVGTSVKLMESGVATEYLVVNQGKPAGSSLYDDSCDGTWLLRKEVLAERVWASSATKYADSSINTWLNGDFYNQYGTVEKAAIKQVKIPYCVGGGSKTVNSGASGLAVKVFLLGHFEAGYLKASYQSQPDDSAALTYFVGNKDSTRIAYRNGAAAAWWTRSPVVDSEYEIMVVHVNGYSTNTHYASTVVGGAGLGPRPAIVVSKTALFDPETLILKGVA